MGEAHLSMLKERDVLKVYQEAKDKWLRKQLEERDGAHRAANEERYERLRQKVVDNKIERARLKFEKHEEMIKQREEDRKRELQQEADRRREEEERRQREEEEKERRREEEDQERRREEQRREAEEAKG